MRFLIRTIKIGKFKFSFKNLQEFILLYLGIYLFGGYKFKSKKENPFIVDCGSHVGMSILSFKKQYPKSKIIGFEPNPETFKILEKNVEQNSLDNIELVNAAVSNREGEIDFYINTKNTWSWGDSLLKTWFVKDKFRKVRVKAVTLSRHLNRSVDLLKLNIEGSETLVMKEIEGKLRNVKEIYLHYHGKSSNPDNNLKEIFRILDRNSYTYTIKQLRSFGIPRLVTKLTIDKREPYFLFIRAKRK